MRLARLRVMIYGIRARVDRVQARVLRVFVFRLLYSAFMNLGPHNGSHMAAGIAYYVILSIFPLLLALIGLLGFFLPAEEVQEQLFEFFEANIPGAVDALEQNIEQVIQLRGTLGILGILGLLWSASAMFGAITRTINRAWGIEKLRPFYIRKLYELGMALGTGLLFILSLGITAFLSILEDIGLPARGIVAEIIGRSISLALTFAIFLILYKYVPNTRTCWKYVWPGALAAAILFLAAQAGFVLYLAHYANYELVYGSIASLIAFLVWVYISAFILVIGAEIASAFADMRQSPSTAE
ncbi:MAG: YihY/virulence factor BrkB family protein [Dehalococcoidia bacterium]|nr:YihY/virulence factor BrkB family protein [Dehalococcoidia bacterium]